MMSDSEHVAVAQMVPPLEKQSLIGNRLSINSFANKTHTVHLKTKKEISMEEDLPSSRADRQCRHQRGKTSGLVELQLPKYVQVLLNTRNFTP